ncbi:MAG TPA: NADH-quinone oxidoreductase subunit N, partial [Opitutales bacterium]|nr:NADH-quinone oxidoreductase subunit N [Opitutales bacterium]
MELRHYAIRTLSFAELIRQTPWSELMRLFFLASGLGVAYLSSLFFKRNHAAVTEFYALLLMTTASLMILGQSHHFIVFFVSLETFTVGLYVMISYLKTSEASLEAGLKYLILASLGSVILLAGIVLLYGIAGNPNMPGHTADAMNFSQLQSFIAANPDHVWVRLGAALVLGGMAFKIGALPFQIWIPDVYQGAPTPVTAYLAISSKGAGFLLLLILMNGPFLGLRTAFTPLLVLVAAGTILFGNLAAAPQKQLKRMMGLSGIAHAGYMLMGVVASFTIEWAAGAVVFYLFTYMIASLAIFAVMIEVGGEDDADHSVFIYEGLAERSPFLSRVLVFGVGSLAGIPPLAGFIGKFFLFLAAYRADLLGLLAVAIFGVVVSIYYYFGWLRQGLFRSWHQILGEEADKEELRGVFPERPAITLPATTRWAFIFLAGLNLVLGLYPGLLTGL